jgi:hypothetical protein
VTFSGKPSVTIPPGESVWSDPVTLPFVKDPPQLELGRPQASRQPARRRRKAVR